MRLIVDTAVLAAEVTNHRGRLLLAHSDLELWITDDIWGETRYEIRERYRKHNDSRHLSRAEVDTLTTRAIAFLNARLQIATPVFSMPAPKDATSPRIVHLADYMNEAARLMPDRNDRTLVALHLATGFPIWSSDRHFQGSGLPVWHTQRLVNYLAASET